MFQETAEPRHMHGSCSIMDGKDRPQNWIAYPLKTDQTMEYLEHGKKKQEYKVNSPDYKVA